MAKLHISDYELVYEGYIDKLAEEFMQMTTKREVLRLLQSLMTETELRYVARRLQIAQELVNRVQQRTIAAYMNVDIASVTFVSKALQQNRYQWLSPQSKSKFPQVETSIAW